MDQKLALYLSAASLAICASATLLPAANADPFKLGVQDSTVLPGQGGYDYPAPQAIQPINGGVQRQQPRRPPMQANVQQQQQRAPIQANIQKEVALPPGYLGTWRVAGQKGAVEALPEFQAVVSGPEIFAPSTNNTWQISGQPGNYSMGNGQINTQFYVDKVGPDGTAFIRYQHPIKNTMAQEAIVLTLAPGGMQFNGLERISIVKDRVTRAKVTYQLMGQRQR